MLRKCIDCGIEAITEEELGNFQKSTESTYSRRNLCIPCGGKRTDNSSQQMKDWKTDHQVKKRYGITRLVYIERMSRFKICGICGKKEDLCYDHDHANMKFRGVLCRGCNRSIGQLGDTLESLKRAVTYLEKEVEQ